MRIDHPTLGTLDWEPDLDSFHGTWDGDPVLHLYVEPDDPANPLATVGGGLEALAAVPPRLPWLTRAVAVELLDLYNDVWTQDDEDLTTDEFVARIRPVAATARSTGVYQVNFDDGGLFLEHLIVLLVNADGTVDEAKLAG